MRRAAWCLTRLVFAALMTVTIGVALAAPLGAPLAAQGRRVAQRADSVPQGTAPGGRGTRSGQSRSIDTRTIATRQGTRPRGGRGPVQCEKCHADRQFLVGKAKSGKGDSVLFVPDTMLVDSRHGTLVCADCHAGYNDGYPHVKVPAVSIACQDCHEDQGGAWTRSIHSQNFEKKGDAATCVSCHSSHRVLGSDDTRSPTYPLNVARLCGSCHNSQKILRAYFEQPKDSTARTAIGDYKRSVHGLASAKAGLLVSATCSDCHDAHRVLPKDSTGSTLSRENVTATCGACHAGVLAAYDSSAHGQALVKGDTTSTGHKAPICVDCHGGHTVVEAGDPVWFRGVVQECGTCHERLLDTYLGSYHGKATELGYDIAAKCSDCHTAHGMLPKKDTLSTVHRSNLVETCGKCHEGATASFVEYMPHADPRDREKNPVVYYVWVYMTALLAGVFIFFGAHTALWFIRARREGHGGHAVNTAHTAHADHADHTTLPVGTLGVEVRKVEPNEAVDPAKMPPSAGAGETPGNRSDAGGSPAETPKPDSDTTKPGGASGTGTGEPR